MDEADGDATVLRVAVPGQQQLAQGDRDALRQIHRRRHVLWIGLVAPGLVRPQVTPQPDALALRLGQQLGRQLCRGVKADDDLARVGRSLHGDHGARAGAGQQQLPVALADEEEVELAGVDADRHAQANLAGRGVDRTHLAERAPHADRGGDAVRGVVLTREEQEQGVPAELDQAAAVGVGRAQQLAEHEADDVGHLLGADAAQPRQPLGHLGEAGDVDEHDRPLERPHPHVRILADPANGQSRQERPQLRRAIGGDVGHVIPR